MSSHQRTFSHSQSQSGTREKTYFEQQREELIGEIAMNFEQVLANINKLNRSLEAVITVESLPFPPFSNTLALETRALIWAGFTASQVGNEFSSVEALWSQFENVMAKEPEENKQGDTEEGSDGETKTEQRS
ncbi:hypothetical protein CaCOL14_001007 [Colletotrichum acutatum]|uniref:DASH complex subunit DAD1 n=1 Tax=Glomerella acutata TaxID=27357 RepID=A0AAD8XN44_GLOAC|nr:uncharacterized protein BDZ83DRAFT_747298 [Colletotrichum acutatum]KAK1730517.1 hypothetical protein BDZ83DRAFT_747298 [Colletotrichum acutatum]